MAYPKKAIQNPGSQISNSRSSLATGFNRETNQVGSFNSGTRAPSNQIQPYHTAPPPIKPNLQHRTTDNGAPHLGKSKPTLLNKFGNFFHLPNKPSVETSAKHVTDQRVASNLSGARGIDFVASTPPHQPIDSFLSRSNSGTSIDMGNKHSKNKIKSSSGSGGKNKTDKRTHSSTRDQGIF